MIWPRVPEAAIEPAASEGAYPRLSITGRLNNPIVTTVAPTIPVEAAINAPTMIIETPRPPRKPPNRAAIASSKSSATFDFSSITPMAINSGTARSTSLVMMPKMRSVKSEMVPKSSVPTGIPRPSERKIPKSANNSAHPEIVKRLRCVKPAFTVGTLSERIAIEALRDCGFLESTVEAVSKERPRLAEAITKLGLEPKPTDANFMLIDVRRPSAEVAQAIAARKILVRSMAGFPGLETMIRVTVGRAEHTDRLVAALEEVL